jgi:hypothetical protein
MAFSRKEEGKTGYREEKRRKEEGEGGEETIFLPKIKKLKIKKNEDPKKNNENRAISTMKSTIFVIFGISEICSNANVELERYSMGSNVFGLIKLFKSRWGIGV